MAPLAVYACYLATRGRLPKRFEAWILRLSVVGYLMAAWLLIVGLAAGYPLMNLVGVKLSYESAVEGMIFGAVIVLAFWFRVRDAVLSVVSSVLCLSAVGWLYEISFFHPLLMFLTPIHLASPLGVNTQIISLILFVWSLWKNGWRMGKVSTASFLLYVVSSIYLATCSPYSPLFVNEAYRWLLRLPSYALLLALVYDTRGKKR